MTGVRLRLSIYKQFIPVRPIHASTSCTVLKQLSMVDIKYNACSWTLCARALAAHSSTLAACRPRTRGRESCEVNFYCLLPVPNGQGKNFEKEGGPAGLGALGAKQERGWVFFRGEELPFSICSFVDLYHCAVINMSSIQHRISNPSLFIMSHSPPL